MKKNTSKTGKIAELRTMIRFIELGYLVLTPIQDSLPFDYVVYKGSEYKRIQAKKGRVRNGVLIFQTHRQLWKNGVMTRVNYTKNEIDCFAVFNSESEETYLIEVEEVSTGHQYLRLEPTKNGQTRRIKFAKDYIL